MGVSHKRFGGWEPKETKTIYRDGVGRVEREEITREVEWDDDQQALVLALAVYKLMYCDGCGGELTETMKIENEFSFKAVGPWLCWGCETVGRARGTYMETHPKAQHPDRWTLEKRR